MSKSLGNFFTVRDLLDQGYPGEVIRFVYLGTHYGKPMDWTKEKAEQAEATLRHWRALTANAVDTGMIDGDLVDNLADDLNTAGAIARLHALAKSISGNPQKDCHIEKSLLLASAGLLGLLQQGMGDWALEQRDRVSDEIRRKIEKCARQWIELRRKKNYVAADALSKHLLSVGIRLISNKTNASEWSYENPDFMEPHQKQAWLAELAQVLDYLK